MLLGWPPKSNRAISENCVGNQLWYISLNSVPMADQARQSEKC